MTKIDLRAAEIKLLDQLYSSNEAEFLAVYGRRRVGKTFLIREYFSKKGLYIEVTGLKDGSMEQQIHNFMQSMSQCLAPELSALKASSWQDVFEIFTNRIAKLPKKKKIILFLDELPWLATKRSGLLQAIDYFWNSQWSKLNNFILVVCGSAASWILDNIVNAKGGLHNRITQQILLQPFNLAQTKKFLTKRGINLTEKQILDIYMVTGGVPHYLKQIQKGKSAVQNIDNLCFKKDSLLYHEFSRLFVSLFEKHEISMAIIRAIASVRNGISREQLINKTKLTSGGTLNNRLAELEAAGFIEKFIPYGRKTKDYYYRVIDEYSIFYLRWIEPTHNLHLPKNDGYWQTKSKTPSWISWAGYAFETICIKHIDQIRKALGLSQMHCDIGSWRLISKEKKTQGAQIDLLFDREDGVITLCEIKYCDKLFTVDKSAARNLANKIQVFTNNFPSSKQIFLALISPKGLKKNIWSEDLIDAEIKLSDLFDCE